MAKAKKDGTYVNIYMDRELNDRLEKYIKTTGQTKTFLIESLLRQFLDDHEEGDYRELDVISLSCKTDEAYIKAMLGAIQKS